MGGNHILILFLALVVAFGLDLIRRKVRRSKERKEAEEKEAREREAMEKESRRNELNATRAELREERADICYQCTYWEAGKYGRVQHPDETPSNECRRYPPILDPSGEWAYPYTGPFDWCGEFSVEPL